MANIESDNNGAPEENCSRHFVAIILLQFGDKEDTVNLPNNCLLISEIFNWT